MRFFMVTIPNKRQVQKIVHIHSSDIDFKRLVLQNHSFLVIDDTLASDNHLCFRKNLLERI